MAKKSIMQALNSWIKIWRVLPLFLVFILACQLDFLTKETVVVTATPNAVGTIAALVTANTQLAIELATSNARLELALQNQIQPLPQPQTPPPPVVPLPIATPVPIQLPPTPSNPVVILIPTVPRPSPTVTPIPGQWEVQYILFSPKTPAHLHALQKHSVNGAYRLMLSTSYGQAWYEFLNIWPVSPGCINNLNLDYHRPDNYYLSTCQGIYYWGNGKWQQQFSRPAGMVTNLPEAPDTLWAIEPVGPAEIPVRVSLANQTWDPASRYLDHTNGLIFLQFDPVDPERFFALASPDYPGSPLRRGASNGQWATLPTPLNNSPIGHRLAVDGVTGALYAVVNRTELWRSPYPNLPDPGQVGWEPLRTFEAGQQAAILGISWPAQQMVLFANVTAAGQVFPVPHYSLDKGQTWAVLPVPLN